MIEEWREMYPIQLLCEVLGCPRSSFYYRSTLTKVDGLVSTIEQIVIRFPRYGYRRVTAQLHREGCQVNHKVVRRVMHALGVKGTVGQVRFCTTDSQHPYPRYPNLTRDLTATHPNHIWVADITYIRLVGRFIYLAIVMDLFNRAIRGWHVDRSLSRALPLYALSMALAHATAQFHHSDQGVQYASRDYINTLTTASIQVSMSDLATPTQNAFAERFMRTFKEEHLDYSDYSSLADARLHIADWIERFYMTERIHSALNYRTPAKAERDFFAQLSA